MVRSWTFAAAALGALYLSSCNGQVPLTAPANAELSITANPTAIPVFDGTSTITVVGFKGPDDGGGPLADGTQIFFTTNVGLIEERVEMHDGVARGTLRSNGRAGLATVTARSGAGITAALETPVLIGNAEGINILLTANPPTVSPPDFSTDLVATVFDNDNNRMAGVPIIFTTTAGALASQSASLRTNALGQATDRLTLLEETSASVTAFSGAIASNAVTVGRGTEPGPVVSSISPTSGQPGETLNVTINGLNFQPGAVVSFGEGIAVNSVRFVNSNQLVATITIDLNIQNTSAARTVTVTNPDGTSGNLPNAFRIITPSPAPVITGLSPTGTATRNANIQVTITGLNFQTGAQVTFTSSAGSVSIVSRVVSSSTQIVVTINIADPPIGPPTGLNIPFEVRVINPDLLQSNAATFTVN
ncbi:MAG TPA: IPT/TIG domain-containing protein [Vicinamibacteria bacterium]|nr:IPT/TIG domain-containing protein [Vicinamibacteria bacterium]